MTAKTLIVGIGNRFRGDDALGCVIADEIKKQVSNSVEVIEHNGDPAALIDLWQGYSQVILIDAVSSGAEPGTMHYVDLRQQSIPEVFRNYSTHALGIAEAVELARVLGKLPLSIVFFGIEGEDFKSASPLSPQLQHAVKELPSKIMEVISPRCGEKERA